VTSAAVVFSAVPTLFGEDGQVDLDANRAQYKLVAGLVDGLFVAGTTGEFPALDDAERLSLFGGTRPEDLLRRRLESGGHDVAAARGKAGRGDRLPGVALMVSAVGREPRAGVARHLSEVRRKRGAGPQKSSAIVRVPSGRPGESGALDSWTARAGAG
jgi:Dihydrodipicolinate synthetase family